ncbi:hypothetical protein W02_09100 [Nitrospira sp. KM1]|uniref:hypothetical protein n=1 Tax=Nitrospira sp. KM1 TaxID=1936990 RepID=UPI0013A758F2|nr:hypothetical protein [Nitrospira sp. KM1]BCA53770.1 hypothetical protein W02_09100 [Nitrospira sp. KM1]
MNRIIVSIALALAVVAAGWANRNHIAVWLAPAKKATSIRGDAAIKADELFWQTFHSGAYDDIQRGLEALTAAYLETPTDAVTAAHIAWLHNWRMAERARLSAIPATITDEMILARRYFEEAVKLNSSDARYLGFLAGHTLAEGTLHKDDRLVRRGYYMLLDAIDAWPEFNLFTAGYVMSRLPADSPRFKEGLAWQWQNLDVCVQARIDRANPDYAKYMTLETKEGVKRVCWNSWIAPHNFEGFFLNMGDMLVKSGDWQTAQRIYANATLSQDYATWPFAKVLEARIARAQENVAAFNGAPDTPARPIMINSAFACAACHQK